MAKTGGIGLEREPLGAPAYRPPVLLGSPPSNKVVVSAHGDARKRKKVRVSPLKMQAFC